MDPTAEETKAPTSTATAPVAPAVDPKAEAAAKEAARISKEKAALRNSLWCTDRAGRVGMINEINGAGVKFHYANADGSLGDPTTVQMDDLKIAKASELPANHGLTEQQCEDTGYL